MKAMVLVESPKPTATNTKALAILEAALGQALILGRNRVACAIVAEIRAISSQSVNINNTSMYAGEKEK